MRGVEHRVHLRDGRELIVRPIEPDDKNALADGLQRLDPESRYLRFLAPVARLSERGTRAWPASAAGIGAGGGLRAMLKAAAQGNARLRQRWTGLRDA